MARPRHKTVRQRQLDRARQRARLARTQQPPAIPQPHTTKKEFLEALRGTGGIKTHIAENLGIDRTTVARLLVRPDWGDVLEAYESEVESGADDAERCIRDAIKQRYDLPTAAANARWYLSRVKKSTFGDTTTTVIEGGEKPLKSVNVNASVPIEALDLPLETKRQILEALEAGDQKKNRAKVIEARPLLADERKEDEDEDAPNGQQQD